MGLGILFIITIAAVGMADIVTVPLVFIFGLVCSSLARGGDRV